MRQFLNITAMTMLAILAFIGCNKKPESADEVAEKRVTVEMATDKGDITIALYNETPLHRDNFVKLANEGAFDSLLFHRVIESFMIQGGDPESKNAKPGDRLGNGGLGYRVDAEFRPSLFHKKGVLAAARDGNPDRASSPIQFYIVQGKVFNDSLLEIAQGRINDYLAIHFAKKDSANQNLVDSLQVAMDNQDELAYRLWNDSLKIIGRAAEGFEEYTIPDEHREIYKTLGGTPHLDQNYTVYGEVIKGLAVVDSIAAVERDKFNRPLADVRIMSVKVLE